MTQIALPMHSNDATPFDAIRQTDGYGEHWLGRDLMPLFEYSRWDKFATVIEKAKASLALVQGQGAADVAFVQVNQVHQMGNLGSGTRIDYRLTRFGAYLAAMAGDDTKEAVARARIYFAVKTREAETGPSRPNYAELDIKDPNVVMALSQAAQYHAARSIELEQRAAQAEVKVAELEPRAQQADFHRSADGLVAVGDFANKVKAWAKREHGVRILHQEVWDFLGDINLLIRGDTIRKNQPTAFAIEREYVRVKETEFETPTGEARAASSSRLTPAGEGWAWDRAVRRIASHGSLKPSTDVERTNR